MYLTTPWIALASALLLACAAPAASTPLHEVPTDGGRADDLAWIRALVKGLGDGTLTRARAVSALGDDGGADPTHEGGRIVRPRNRTIASALVYPLPHIATPVAIELDFARGAEPSLDAIARSVGELRPLPRAPDDFSSGERLARYVDRDDTKITVRVIAELDRESKRVAKLFVDASRRE
ncbi:MAG TPA: hypothetical protein VGH28_03930 [Polyangiaceae bacterium]|jgi:hypothetical protein